MQYIYYSKELTLLTRSSLWTADFMTQFFFSFFLFHHLNNYHNIAMAPVWEQPALHHQAHSYAWGP